MSNVDINELKIVIKSLVISSKSPLAVGGLLREYKEIEGRELPFASLGYSNPLDLLHDLKDTVKVLPGNIVTATESPETQHLVELIKRQRPCQKRQRKTTNYQSNTVNYGQRQYDRQNAVHHRNVSGSLGRARYSGPEQNDRQRGPNRYDDRRASSNRRYDQPSSRSTNYDNGRSNVYYGDRYGRRLSDQHSGVNNRRETVSDVVGEDDVQHVQSEKDDPSLDIQEPQVSVTRVHSSSRLPPRLETELRDLIFEHPEGITCSQLSQLVAEKYKAPLNLRRCGFLNMAMIVDAIPGVTRIADDENKDSLVVDARKASTFQLQNKGLSIPLKRCDRVLEVSKLRSLPITTPSFDKRYEPSSWEAEDSDKINYPEFMLPLGVKVPVLEPFSGAITPTMDVKLGEIYGPHHFFMLLTCFMNDFDTLHNHMQSFYAQSSHLALTNVPAKKGLYCAVQYVDKWHRAVIAKVCDQIQVMVYLIDFGTILKLPKSEVRFLHKDFASMPRLAHRASLSDIVPSQYNTKFSREAVILFYKLTRGKKLQALIKRVDFTPHNYQVEIFDTSEDPDVSVSKRLVNACVAEYRQNLNNRNVSSAAAADSEPTPSPSSSSAPLKALEKLSLQESAHQEENKVTADTANEGKEKKSFKSVQAAARAYWMAKLLNKSPADTNEGKEQ